MNLEIIALVTIKIPVHFVANIPDIDGVPDVGDDEIKQRAFDIAKVNIDKSKFDVEVVNITPTTNKQELYVRSAELGKARTLGIERRWEGARLR